MMVTMVLMIMTEVVPMLSMLRRRRKRKSNIKTMYMMLTIQRKMVSTYLVHNGDVAQHGRHL